MIRAGELHRRWRALPFGSLHDIRGTGTALILAPHPDDESLGCGGLIAACCSAGRPPVLALLTDGSASHPGSKQYPPAKLAALREAEAANAAAILGLARERIVFLRQPDSNVAHAGPRFEAVVRKVAQCVTEFCCSAIFATWQHDPHCDHEAAGLVAAAVVSITGIRHFAYPVWGWTVPGDKEIGAPPVSGWRLDISPHLTAKRRAIAAHASQYGGIITDDPTAFRLPDTLLRAFETPWETFLRP